MFPWPTSCGRPRFIDIEEIKCRRIRREAADVTEGRTELAREVIRDGNRHSQLVLSLEERPAVWQRAIDGEAPLGLHRQRIEQRCYLLQPRHQRQVTREGVEMRFADRLDSGGSAATTTGKTRCRSHCVTGRHHVGHHRWPTAAHRDRCSRRGACTSTLGRSRLPNRDQCCDSFDPDPALPRKTRYSAYHDPPVVSYMTLRFGRARSLASVTSTVRSGGIAFFGQIRRPDGRPNTTPARSAHSHCSGSTAINRGPAFGAACRRPVSNVKCLADVADAAVSAR